MQKKQIHIIGGGTFSYVRNHLSLAVPAFGTTAKTLATKCMHRMPLMEVKTHLTKMAQQSSSLVTNDDVANLVDEIVQNLDAKIVFFTVGLCDYIGTVSNIESGKYARRLKTVDGVRTMTLTPAAKILQRIRKSHRKDILLVACKTTCDASEDAMYTAGLKLLKEASANLVLVNDTVTHVNMIVTPEEARYCVTTDRNVVLDELVDMAFHRSQLSFTTSTVVAGNPVPWDSEHVYPALRTVVDYCIASHAYKPFNGATVGHFACKISENEFLTSIRKSNFNDLMKNGLVRVVTDGPDTVIAYGAKPSVGGQSQRIIFSEHNDYDCIVHFHCPLKQGSIVPVVSQREYECGSHECGQNTSHGLQQCGNLSAVMLDKHGPNIVFHHSIDPQEVIDFIDANFDLSDKTGGKFVENETDETKHEIEVADMGLIPG